MKLLHGFCEEKLKELEDNSIDAIITDPPYGLSQHSQEDVLDCLKAWIAGEEFKPNKKGFMGKSWDSWVPSPIMWKEAFRVLKPGGHIACFAGSRTHDLMSISLRLAGFENRDTVLFIYGSGFPKSLNIGKALDKMAGAEREVIGQRADILEKQGADIARGHRKIVDSFNAGAPDRNNGFKTISADITAPSTEAAKKWDGWGTALKPAHEEILLFQKPHNLQSLCIDTVKKIKDILCQLQLYVNVAKNNLKLNQREFLEVFDSVLWSAVKKCNTREDLFVLMDMLPSKLMIPMSLNIGLSWLNILGDLLTQENMYTIETEINLITDLKTLNYYLLKITPQSLIQEGMLQLGMKSDVSIVTHLLQGVLLKAKITQENFVQGNVTLKEKEKDLRHNLENILLFRKPIEGTVAENVLKFGVGGINIDECRIESELSEGRLRHGGGSKSDKINQLNPLAINSMPSGRFPANIIHDGSEEVVNSFPETTTGSHKPYKQNVKGWANNSEYHYFENTGDSGSASRFFYTAKASQEDRDEGCEELPLVEAKRTQDGGDDTRGRPTPLNHNNHPTVKPTSLMRYICKLITPKGGIILDPFMGSGSTGKAAVLEDFDFIGIEQDENYYKIAEARINHVKKQPKQLGLF